MMADNKIFFAYEKRSQNRIAMMIVSPDRCIDMTYLYSTWLLQGSQSHPSKIVATNGKYLHPNYEEPVEHPSQMELILLSGRNETDLEIDTEDIELPCLLTTSASIETCVYHVEGTLRISTWSESVDFQAEQRFWIAYYEKQIALGSDFLKVRLDDYTNEQKLAETMPIESPTRLPISFDFNGKQVAGCLLVESLDGRRFFVGKLFCNHCFKQTPLELRRNVRWKNGIAHEIDQVVATNIKLNPI